MVTTPEPAARERLPESASLLLDVIRFGLAVLVVAGHITLPWVSWGWPPLLALADAAVPGFFVLSGFMIRYVTLDRERDPRRYFISRASRMYSVLLPAIALTLLSRLVIRQLNPGFWRYIGGHASTAGTVAQVTAHLLFLTQNWGHAVQLAPNLPLWSLGYEVPYYVLFGLVMLCRGAWRWWAAALYALVLGPQVLFLLPLWWSGCWLYDCWQWSRRSKARAVGIGISGIIATFLLTAPLHGRALTARIAAARNPLVLLHQFTNRATMLAYACGLVAWLLMLCALLASDAITLQKRTAWARRVRRVADGTFTLYLFHYPLLSLVTPLHGALVKSWSTWLLLLAVTAICVALAVPIDLLKRWMRRVLSSRFEAPAANATH